MYAATPEPGDDLVNAQAMELHGVRGASLADAADVPSSRAMAGVNINAAVDQLAADRLPPSRGAEHTRRAMPLPCARRARGPARARRTSRTCARRTATAGRPAAASTASPRRWTSPRRAALRGPPGPPHVMAGNVSRPAEVRIGR